MFFIRQAVTLLLFYQGQYSLICRDIRFDLLKLTVVGFLFI